MSRNEPDRSERNDIEPTHKERSASPPPRCELCGEPNACAMESDDPAVREAPCWCVDEVFPKELLQTVDELRAEGAAKRCICRRCLARHAESG